MDEKDIIEKKIYTEGVNCQGFGIIYKALTTDGSIPIQSKAIYAYLASFAGASNRAFPSVDKMMRDLGFTHSSYFYKYLNILLDNGYLKISKFRNSSNNYLRNEYILTTTREDLPSHDELDSDALFIEGFAAYGYGTVPKKVMVDTSLSIAARAVYAYFCSYSGAGNTCMPSQSLICSQLKIDKKSFYKYLKELEEAGYIKTKKNQSDTGRTLKTQYFLIEKPVLSATEKHKDDATEFTKKSDLQAEEGWKFRPPVSHECSQKEGWKFSLGNFSPVKFSPTNNNSINNNSINNNKNNINKSSSEGDGNVYPQLKEMMINKFNYTCTHEQMFISDVIRDNTGLIEYLTVYNEIIASSPVAAENKLCSAKIGRERALVLAQAISVLYRDKKICLEDIKNLEYIYSKSRESKVINPKKYIEAIIKFQKDGIC